MTDDELKRLLERHAEETRRHFDVATERVERRFEALAETVMHVDQKIDRTADANRDEMRRGFADTQAMIKFSHAELDQRVRSLESSHRAIEESQRSLEETVADLQARLERIESTTH